MHFSKAPEEHCNADSFCTVSMKTVALKTPGQELTGVDSGASVSAVDAEPSFLLLTQVLVYCFRTLLAIAHPLMPFVTERLWTTIPAQQQQLLITSQWPSHSGAVDEQALTQYQVC